MLKYAFETILSSLGLMLLARKARSSIGQKKTQAAVIDSGVAMSGIFSPGIHSGHLVMPNIHAGIQTMQSDHVQYQLYLVFSLRSYTHALQGL